MPCTKCDPPIWLRLTILTLMALASLTLGRLTVHGLSARARLARLEALSTSYLLTPEGLDRARHELRGLQGDLSALRPAAGMVGVFGGLPVLGRSLRALPHLLDVGLHLARAGEYACTGARPLVAALAASRQPLGERLARATAEERARLSAAVQALGRADLAAGKLRRGDPPPALTAPLDQAEPYRRAIESAVGLIPHLPGLLGEHGPRTYLLVVQDSDQLRPAGGVITGIAAVTLHRGQIIEFSYDDSHAIEDWTVGRPAPPKPLRQRLELARDGWTTRDAGWWSDWPTSAQAILAFYALNRRTMADGVLAVDLAGLALLVDALGALEVPGHGIPLDGLGLVTQLRRQWARPTAVDGPPGLAIAPHKPFTGLVVQAHYQRQAGAAWFDDLQLLDSLGRNLLANPSFEIDRDTDGLPDDWKGIELGPQDGWYSERARSGRASAVLWGDGHSHKALVQRVQRAGRPGEVFHLRGWGWVEGPGDGTYGLAVVVEHADGTTAWHTLNLPRREKRWSDGAAWARLAEWRGQGSRFLAAALEALVGQIQHGTGDTQLLNLARAIARGLDSRHLQVYSVDRPIQSWLARHNWDGALPATDGDLLLVADANVGHNQVNAHIRSQIAYRVALAADGGGLAELAITYHNASPPVAEPCRPLLPYTMTYEEATEGCYWNYLRVYAPWGSRLISLVGSDQASPPTTEGNHAVFGAYLILAPGETRTVRLSYELPGGLFAAGRPYTLWARKQAGTAAVPITVEVVPPPGLAPAGTRPGPMRLEARLDTDQVFVVPLP